MDFGKVSVDAGTHTAGIPSIADPSGTSIPPVSLKAEVARIGFSYTS